MIDLLTTDSFLTQEPTSTLVKVTLLLAIALIGHRLLRPRSAAARHLWAILSLAGLIAIPVLSVALPSWSLQLPALETPTSSQLRLQPTVPYQATPRAGAAERSRLEPTKGLTAPATAPRSSDRGPSMSGFATMPPAPLPTGTVQSEKSSMPISRMVLLWAAVASLLLLRLGLGALRVLGWIARSQEPNHPAVAALSAEVADQLGCQRPTVLVSERSRVPLLWGYFRPILLLPRAAESWDHDRLRVVITHEIAHLERGDWMTLLLGRIAVSVYWFHPLAWYLEQQARRDCEEACDDRVLATGTRASDYASHLLELSRGLQGGVAPQPAVALLRASQVEQRLRAILHPTRERRSPTRRFVGIAAGVLLLLLVPLASVRLEAWDPTPQRSSVLIGGSTTLDPLPLSDWPDETDSGESLFEGAARVIHGQLAQVFHSPGDSWKVNRDRANRHPESGQEWFELAYDYHNDERWEEAYQAFIEAANAGYRPGTSAYNAACGLARLGQTADALQWLERSLRDGFDSYDHLFEDSDLDSLRSDRSFRSLLDEYRSKAGSSWHPAQDRLEQAEGGYEKLVTSDHQDGDKWHEVGTDLLSLGEYDRAIESLQRSIELDPHQSSTTRYNLACAYARAGQTGNALDALDNAVEAGFGSDERFENDRDLDSIRGTPRFDEIRAKSEVLSLDRFQYRGDTWFSRGSRDIDPARWNPAVEAYRPFVERYPNSGRGWFNLGYSLHYSGRHVEAIEAFDRALDLGFKPGQQMYNIACAHARLGNTDQALTWLKRSADSGWSIAHYLDDDKDLDSLRSDRRFQEFERAQWLESKRQSLMEHKRELEYKLRNFSESGKSDIEWKVQEAERRAHEFRIQAELMERQRNASWLKADRERAIEAERRAAKDLERAQTEEQNAWREATTAELEQLKAKLAREQAELERRKAQLEAQLEDQAGGDVDLDPVVEAEQDN